MNEYHLERGKQRGKSKTPDTGTWPPKLKRGVSVYCDLDRPKTANLEKPSVLDPKLADKLDMSLLSKELLSDSMTLFRHSKTISGGTSVFPSSSRCRQDVTADERQQQKPASNGSTETWCDDFATTRHKRRTFEQILETRFGHVDLAGESPRMQKQARINGQDAVATKRSTDNKKLDDNNNRFVVILIDVNSWTYEFENRKVWEFRGSPFSTFTNSSGSQLIREFENSQLNRNFSGS